MSLAEDRLGQLWVGTTMGLRCYDANFQRKQIPDIHAEVKALLVDRNDRLWIGTTGLGLASLKNGAYTHLQRVDGLANENVTSLFEDHEGTLWVGTRNGLSQLTDVKLPILSSNDGILGGGSHSVCPSTNGGVWAATTRGLSYLNKNTIRNYSNFTETGLVSPYIKLVYEARDGDIYTVDGDKFIRVLSAGKVVASHPNANWPTAFGEDSHGVLVSVSDRLFRVSRDRLVPYDADPANPLPLNWVFNLSACRDGSILVASANGLFRLKNGAVERWSVEDGLSDNLVFWAGEDTDGAVWAGLGTGIARINGRKVRNITMTNGLYDNFILAIVPDDYGSFWFNSTRGIFQVSRQSLNDFADGRISSVESTAYDSIDAVKMVDTTEVERSGCKTADGRIWFPSPAGIITINPTNLVKNFMPPPVHIQQARANGCELVGNEHPAVRPGKGDLEFQYTAATFIAPQKVRFRYILQGYEPAWVDAGGRRSAFYTNLKPGKYQFQVQACNADGIWNTTGDSFEVQLPPHFYQTAWFKVLYGLLGIALLAGIYAWRVRHFQQKQRKLQKTNELLESKVRERTHELLDATRRAGMAEIATNVLHNVGNVLNSVNVSASLVEDVVRKSGSSRLDKVTALLREHEQNLAGFLADDETGKRLIPYLETLNRHLHAENTEVLSEMKDLGRNIEHIKEIVAMQQTYARVTGVTEIVNVSELVEDALRMHALDYERQGISLVRDFADVPALTSDRHKILQILLSLLKNAQQACEAVEPSHRKVTVRIAMARPGCIKIEVADSGVGIPSANLSLIFSHGFTTRENGYGYSLHNGSLAAKELGGTLTAASEGPGKGATFVLELPLASEIRT
jgi:signal transduction histidine kinase/streptogramin lyase